MRISTQNSFLSRVVGEEGIGGGGQAGVSAKGGGSGVQQKNVQIIFASCE